MCCGSIIAGSRNISDNVAFSTKKTSGKQLDPYGVSFYQLFLGGLLFFLMTIISDGAKDVIKSLYLLSMEYFYVRLEVRTHQAEYEAIMQWLSRKHRIGASTRNIGLKSENHSNNSSATCEDLFSAGERRGTGFVPGYGLHRLSFQGNTLWVTREIDTSRRSSDSLFNRMPDEIITVVVLDRSLFQIIQDIYCQLSRAFGIEAESRNTCGRAIIEEWLCEVRLEAAESNTTTIYVPAAGSFGHWRLLDKKQKRLRDTLFLNDPHKMFGDIEASSTETCAITMLSNDIAHFFKQSGQYRRRGVPWRRGLLFYGPPGTGKTSALLTIAGEAGVPVYLIPCSRHLSDTEFIELLHAIPAPAILALEDFHLTFADQLNSSCLKADSRLTLGGVLQALDGVASGEGRVIVITANFQAAQDLPDALCRPGRIDRRVYFGPADESTIHRMLLHFDVPEDVAQDVARQSLHLDLTAAQIQQFAALYSRAGACSVDSADKVASLLRQCRSEIQ